MAEQIRNLDFHMIERASEKYANLREVVIAMEIEEKVETFIVEIYKHFAPVQIKMCVEELIEKMDNVRVYDKDGMSKILIPYLMFLIVKHFTTLELPNSFSQQLKAIEHMTNTGTLFQIFMNMDDEQIGRIADEVLHVVDQFEANMENASELREKVKGLLVDKSLME